MHREAVWKALRRTWEADPAVQSLEQWFATRRGCRGRSHRWATLATVHLERPARALATCGGAAVALADEDGVPVTGRARVLEFPKEHHPHHPTRSASQNSQKTIKTG